MAIREIVKEGNDCLRKVCRPVEKFDERLAILLDDMAQTMYEGNGVGLAAPQVGVLRRVVVIDCGDQLYELINPEIIAQAGALDEAEGCLSSPGAVSYTHLYRHVVCAAGAAVYMEWVKNDGKSLETGKKFDHAA